MTVLGEVELEEDEAGRVSARGCKPPPFALSPAYLLFRIRLISRRPAACCLLCIVLCIPHR